MRLEGFYNTKDKDNWIEVKLASDCELNTGNTYNTNEFEKILPKITEQDEKDITKHIEKVFNEKTLHVDVDTDNIPEKFMAVLEKSQVLKKLFYEPDDRSVCDMKIANMLYFYEFSREEVLSALVHTNKAQERGIEYAQAIVDKVYDNPPNRNEINDELFSPEEIDALQRENYAYKVIKENERLS